MIQSISLILKSDENFSPVQFKMEYSQISSSDSSEKLTSSEERKPTNVWAIYFCAGFVVILFGFIGYGFSQGNIYRIINGIDDCGNICGFDNPGNPLEYCGPHDKRVDRFTLVNITHDEFNPNITHSHSTCVKNCSDFPGYAEIANRCYFVNATGEDEEETRSFFQSITQDLSQSVVPIILTCIVALVFSYLLLILFRHAIKYVIWVIFIGIVALFFVGSIASVVAFFVMSAKGGEEKEKAHIFLIFAGVLFLVGAIFGLVLFFFRKRIRLVVQLFKEASKALVDVPLIIVEPVLTFIALGLTFTSFIYFALVIQSAGTLTTQKVKGEFYKAEYQPDGGVATAAIVNIIAFLWFTAFIFGCQNFVIAGTVCQWFFSRNKSKLDSPIQRAFKFLMKFHLGSVCLGSMLITIIKIIRMIVEGIKNSLRDSNNAAAKIAAACCDCIMGILEEFLQYLVRNAYIVVAMDGTPLITSGKKAFNLLKANLIDVIALNKVGDFILFLGKLFVVVVSGFICYELVSRKDGINSPIFPVLISLIFAYLIVDCFLTVFEMTIDTIFICFCEDREQNDGISRPYYMSVGMMEVMQEFKREAGGEFNFGGQNVDPGARPILPPALPPSYGFNA